MLIFKGAHHLHKYFANDIHGDTLFGRSESGFTNNKLTLAWLKHFNQFTEKRTVGQYRLLIFNGYGSHITQEFIEYCWEHRIRPFQLLPHSTHILQPLDVGIFQTYKKNFKEAIQREVFHGLTQMTKTDFFSIFQGFSDRTFKPKLIQSAFRKTGLVPFNPSIVLDAMKDYGGHQGTEDIWDESSDSEPAFGTPPPLPWRQYTTPITNIERKRGSEYIQQRIQNGPITPTVIRVMQKVEKGTEKMVIQGQLSKELLAANNAYAKQRKERKEGSNKVVQKYGEIYGRQARRQALLDEVAEGRVVNMHEKRLAAPYKKRYQRFVKDFFGKYCDLRSQGHFSTAGSSIELDVEF
jgi:hypothetical protein